MRFYIAIVFLLCVSPAMAKVSIETKDNYLIIQSDGIPNHQTGQFPNSGNPNAISKQNHAYRVTLNPQKTGRITAMQGQPFGVGINGVPFDPATAECYGQPRGSRPSSTCEWREEGIVNGKGLLGLDHHNAHVQPNGAYHYHGVPNGLVKGESDLIHVGYAADGFKMYVSRSDAYKSSYRLKSGVRPSGPAGRYTGKYTQDFEYVSNLGDLDQCNGMTTKSGQYIYLVTQEFPFVPRCWVGTPDSSFAKRRGSQNRSGEGRHRRPPPPHHHRF